MSALTHLIERRQLVLPGTGEVLPAHSRFRLFATRTSTNATGNSGTAQINQFLDSFWVSTKALVNFNFHNSSFHLDQFHYLCHGFLFLKHPNKFIFF